MAVLLFLGECLQYDGKEDGKMSQERYKLAEKLKIPEAAAVSENFYIYCYNHELCKEKGLLEEGRLGSRYLCMQALYRANLDAFLLEKLDLRALEDELKNSDLKFTCRQPENRDLYERESTMGLEYIYLRNNLYIEYLEEEQLKLLETQLTTGMTAVTNEVKEMTRATYREIIRVRTPVDWEGQDRFLYSEVRGSRPKIPNQALVLGIVNAIEYDSYGNLLSEERMREKCEYLDQVKAEKEKEYSGILGVEVYILPE